MKNINREFWLIIVAFLMIYVVWGATYLTNAWAVKSVPPFIMSGSRFIIAGGIMLGFISIFSPIHINRRVLQVVEEHRTIRWRTTRALRAFAMQYEKRSNC